MSVWGAYLPTCIIHATRTHAHTCSAWLSPWRSGTCARGRMRVNVCARAYVNCRWLYSQESNIKTVVDFLTLVLSVACAIFCFNCWEFRNIVLCSLPHSFIDCRASTKVTTATTIATTEVAAVTAVSSVATTVATTFLAVSTVITNNSKEQHLKSTS